MTDAALWAWKAELTKKGLLTLGSILASEGLAKYGPEGLA